ncbi:hypothetical protein ASG54_17875 [Aureimonas sp. Leaf460]|nr:hypothetical protein ASG62_16600 [Aureimonas sp. Leaf427]KQT73249.1 hypothetical protein ASG54_17875 [Aureimonas sp. Leaf460]
MYFTDFPEEGPRVRPHPGWLMDEEGGSRLLTDAELAEHGFRLVIYRPPAFDADRERVETRPLTQWLVSATTAIVAYQVATLPVQEVGARKLAAIDQERNGILSAGYPVPGTSLHIDMSDGTRADLGAVAVTALVVKAGALAWPEGYAHGWITMENERLPLPTPDDGIGLAYGVGAFYSVVVQHGRTLKDSVLALIAADDIEGILAIDASAGWPTP